jgi:N-acetylneuraminate synthase
VTETYIIAEIGINHNGSLDLAKELIRDAHAAGADAVKFQKRTLELVYTPEELDKHRESPWGTTNRQQKEGLEFSIEKYKELETYTKFLDMDFIVSCWDTDSVKVIEEHLDVSYHKVASALATDREFLQSLNHTKKPVILSTGMCTSEQVAAAIDILDNTEYVLACTSTYPTYAEEINLRYITTLANKYPTLKAGFSNHYSGHDACVGAVAHGARCIEFHVTKDRTMYGSDQAASIEKVKELISAIRNMEKMLGDGVKRVYESENPIAKKLRKVDDTTR